jgi:hypothetical protein
MTKTPFSSKNPATIAKSFSTGSSHPQGVVGEVVCPLFNSDGSQCRKKCVGVSSNILELDTFYTLESAEADWRAQNFAYRSICEHIRRAHPDNWIPKLPASPETFAKMVGMAPRNNNPGLQMGNGMMHHVPVQQMRKPTVARKPSKRKFTIIITVATAVSPLAPYSRRRPMDEVELIKIMVIPNTSILQLLRLFVGFCPSVVGE